MCGCVHGSAQRQFCPRFLPWTARLGEIGGRRRPGSGNLIGWNIEHGAAWSMASVVFVCCCAILCCLSLWFLCRHSCFLWRWLLPCGNLWCLCVLYRQCDRWLKATRSFWIVPAFSKRAAHRIQRQTSCLVVVDSACIQHPLGTTQPSMTGRCWSALWSTMGTIFWYPGIYTDLGTGCTRVFAITQVLSVPELPGYNGVLKCQEIRVPTLGFVARVPSLCKLL